MAEMVFQGVTSDGKFKAVRVTTSGRIELALAEWPTGGRVGTDEYGVFARIRPLDTNECDLYSLAEGEQIDGTVVICNQDGSARTYSIAITDAGAGVAASGADWIAYQTAIAANVTATITVRIKTTATIRVVASVANLISFVLMGRRWRG